MITIIVPPIIILLVIGLLITIFAKAVHSMPEEEKRESVTTKKSSGLMSRMKDPLARKASRIKTSLQKTAAQREKVVSQKVKEFSGPVENTIRQEVAQPQQKTDNSPQEKGTKLSRMGELIMSYHRDGAQGADAQDMGQDSREALLVKNIELHPQNPDSYQQLGDYYMEMQKFEDARESYKYVLRLDPRHKVAQEAMKNLDRVLG